MSDQEINAAIEKLAFKHQLAVEHLTEGQLADAVRQSILSGDFQRHISTDNHQSVTYTPFRKLKDAERERDEAREERDIALLEAEEISQELTNARKHLAAANKGAEINSHINNSLTAKLAEARGVLQEIANASHFDNIGNWARNKARQALEELK